MRLEPWELVVLDSPVLQRLRHIHQLGLAGYVFPGANYSRFEHTIGVLHQVQRQVESINRNARAYAARIGIPSYNPVSQDEEILLRMSALVHDLGHGFLSHVSERAMSRLSSVNNSGTVADMRISAAEYFGCPNPPAVAEILSALIVLLPEFVEMLDAAQVPLWRQDPVSLADKIAMLIVGGRVATRPFLSELISGALDADKLDYMPRDCYMAGLPMPIDVDRLLEKVQVVGVRADVLPPDYAEQYHLSAESIVYVLAVQTGGARAFEELVVSRVLLYDKLYNHQKVRAVEGMIENILDLLTEESPAFGQFSTYLTLSDSDFVSGHWPASGDDNPKVRSARQLTAAVSQRQIFVRAFAFGPGLISFPDPKEPANDPKIRMAWDRLKPLVTRRRTAAARAFRTQVVDRARLYLQAIGHAGLARDLTEHHLVIDLPDVQGIAEKTRFYVGDEEYGIELYNKRFRVERWAEAYENQKLIGYVFCPPEFCVAIYLTVRQLIRELAGLSFDHNSWGLTKLSPHDIAKTSALLVARKVLSNPFTTPPEVSQRYEYLQSTARKRELLSRFDTQIDDLTNRFKTYQAASGASVGKADIYEWILQFGYDEIALAVDLLRGIRYWDRMSLVDSFVAGIQDRPDMLPSQWIALGGPTTSARHLAYLWPDLRKLIVGGGVLTLLDSPADNLDEDQPVVFYDDNVGSGGQGTTVLQQWFGIPREAWAVQEEHVAPLIDDVSERLRRCSIRFLFATGRRDGLDRLVKKAQELVGHSDVSGYIISPSDISCFRPAARVFADAASAERARQACEAAGRRALSDKKGVWPQVKIDDRLVGYGNAGGLSVFYYNVPTTTVTALWKGSADPQEPWRALFLRRPRE